MLKKYYHTQEHRKIELTLPKVCVRDDAWLGEASYFWAEEFDAMNWGQASKKKTGKFEIYISDINTENILDTVFNEDHYYFWIKQLEKVSKKILITTKQKPTLKELNDYLLDKKVWSSVDGIQFQDLPITQEHMLVKPITYSNQKIRQIAFRKRIQLAVYNPKIITTFARNSVENVF